MKTILMTAVCSLALSASAFAADVTLRASHQWPGGKGDVRDEMVQMIGKDIEDANVGLKLQVFPGESLFKAKDQWGAVTKGQVDITAFPLDYASGRHPSFSATLMPGLVRQPRARQAPERFGVHEGHQGRGRKGRRDRPLRRLARRRLRLVDRVHHHAGERQGPDAARRGPCLRGDAGRRRRVDLVDAVLGNLHRHAAERPRPAPTPRRARWSPTASTRSPSA